MIVWLSTLFNFLGDVINSVVSLTSKYLRVYRKELEGNINEKMPSKPVQQENVLLELPMLGCTFKIELKRDGHFSRTKIHIISIISYNGDWVELLFYGSQAGDNEQFHEWFRHILESEKRSKSNTSRLMEQRSSQVKPICSRTPEVTRKASISFTDPPVVPLGDPTYFVETAQGNSKF